LTTEFKGHFELKGTNTAWGPGDIAEIMTCGSAQEERAVTANDNFCVVFKATAAGAGQSSKVEVY